MDFVPFCRRVFRNYATGLGQRLTDYISGVVITMPKICPAATGPLRAAGVMAYTYWMAFVGNVLGTSGVLLRTGARKRSNKKFNPD